MVKTTVVNSLLICIFYVTVSSVLIWFFYEEGNSLKLFLVLFGVVIILLPGLSTKFNKRNINERFLGILIPILLTVTIPTLLFEVIEDYRFYEGTKIEVHITRVERSSEFESEVNDELLSEGRYQLWLFNNIDGRELCLVNLTKNYGDLVPNTNYFYTDDCDNVCTYYLIGIKNSGRTTPENIIVEVELDTFSIDYLDEFCDPRMKHYSGSGYPGKGKVYFEVDNLEPKDVVACLIKTKKKSQLLDLSCEVENKKDLCIEAFYDIKAYFAPLNATHLRIERDDKIIKVDLPEKKYVTYVFDRNALKFVELESTQRSSEMINQQNG